MNQLVIVLSCVILTVSGDCIWNKVCYTDEDTGKSFNCPYNGPGVPIEDEDAQKILLNRCPEMFTNCKIIQNKICYTDEAIKALYVKVCSGGYL